MSRRFLIADTVREEWFTPEELATADAFRLPKRRQEWLRCRTAAKELALERGLVADPLSCLVERPRLVIDGAESPWFVSLSHSEGWAGAAIDAAPVGIDVQAVREIAEEASHLFLTDAETEEMRRCSLGHRMLHFWCAKEAAWKQRFGELTTLKQVAVTLVEEREAGLLFDVAETNLRDGLIVAITRPISSAIL